MIEILWFSLANLGFVDCALEMLNRLCAMAVEFAFGMLQMLLSAAHLFDCFVYSRVWGLRHRRSHGWTGWNNGNSRRAFWTSCRRGEGEC